MFPVHKHEPNEYIQQYLLLKYILFRIWLKENHSEWDDEQAGRYYDNNNWRFDILIRNLMRG